MSDWLSTLLDPQLDAMGATTVYVVLFTFVFVETGILIGFFLPGDSILFTAGLLSGAPGTSLSLPVLVVGVTVAAIAGDEVGYLTGQRLGRPWLEGWAGRRGERMRASCGGRGVLRALGPVGGRRRPVHPLGAHLHADPGRRRADAVPAVPGRERGRSAVLGCGLVTSATWRTRSPGSRRSGTPSP